MTRTILPIGTQIALDVHGSSGSFLPTGLSLNTLSDLFDILGRNPPKTLSMLRSTWAKFAEYLQLPADQITIDSVFEKKEDFLLFLKSRTYAKNSVRSYGNYIRILLASAEEFGWNPNEAFPEAWRGVLALAPERKCADAAKYLARKRKSPAAVTIQDVDDWSRLGIEQGRTHSTMQARKTLIWRLLLDCGSTQQTPVCLLRQERYGIPMKQLPLVLKNELAELLRWKQALFSVGRGEKHRAITGKGLEEVTCALIGFALNIHGQTDVTSLSQIATEAIVGAYVEWRINVRQVKGASVRHSLLLLSAALRQHPKYKPVDFSWFKPLIDSIPLETKDDLKERKALKYVQYEILEAIPGKIRADRPLPANIGADQIALSVMKELLMTWLVTLPWRQRNIRECRVGGPSPNLFKGRIPPFSDIDKPQWVKDEELKNPLAEFWQFKFSSDETKMENTVRALLPKQLIEILEEYLADHRPRLLKGADPLTLFVTRGGTSMGRQPMTSIVSQLTTRYAGKRVTPHPFRDIFAFTWLKAHPKDYLTLSKMLWHTNIQTTIDTYGGRFNESSGVCATEEWLDERAAKRK